MVTTTESIVRQAPYLEDFQKKILESAFARGETPVSIPGIDVAALDPLTLLALQKGQGIGQFQPFLTTGAGTIGQGLATLQDDCFSGSLPTGGYARSSCRISAAGRHTKKSAIGASGRRWSLWGLPSRNSGS